MSENSGEENIMNLVNENSRNNDENKQENSLNGLKSMAPETKSMQNGNGRFTSNQLKLILAIGR